MKKLLTVLSFFIGIGVISISTTFAAPGDVTPSMSILGVSQTYTPTRSGFDLDAHEEFPGYDFTTYNNFRYTNGLLVDERAFTRVNYNNALDTNGEKLLSKKWEGEFLEEEKPVYFVVRFHNNSIDNYDGLDPTGPTDANTAYIGIDATTENTGTIIDPIGFIYAEENIYKDILSYDPISYGNIKTYTPNDGNYRFEKDTDIGISTASDYVELEHTGTINETLKLTIDQDYAKLMMEYDFDENGKIEGTERFVDNVNITTSGTTIKIPVETKESGKLISSTTSNPEYELLTRTITKHGSDNKIWIQFPEHPGCFRYSGYAIFRGTIKIIKDIPPPNTQQFCSELELIGTGGYDSDPVCSGEEKKTPFTIDIHFTDADMDEFLFTETPPEDEPSPQYVKLSSDDPYSKVLLGDGSTVTLEEPKVVKLIQPGNILTGTYIGLGTLTAIYTDAQGIQIDGSEIIIEETPSGMTTKVHKISCLDSTPTCDDDCEKICVEHPEKIPEGSWSTFSATTTGFYGDEWQDQIRYIISGKHGEFYETKAALLAAHPEAYENPYDYTNTCDLMDKLLDLIDSIYKENTKTIKVPDQEINEINKIPEPQEQDFIEIPGQEIPTQDFKKVPGTKVPDMKIPGDFGGTNVFGTNVFGANIFGTKTLIADDFKIYTPYKPIIPPKPEIETSTYMNVNQGDTIYFYAAEAGEDVLTIRGLYTDNPDCEETFDIIALECESMEGLLALPPPNNDTTLTCIPNDQQVSLAATNIKIVDSDGEEVAIPDKSIKVLWSSGDENSVFYELFNQNQFSTPLETWVKVLLYKGTGGVVSSQVTKIGGIDIKKPGVCLVKFLVCPPEPEPSCKNLTLEFTDGTTEMKVGEVKDLKLEVKSNKDETYKSEILWTDTSGGTLTFENPEFFTQPNKSNYDAAGTPTFTAPTQPGFLKAAVIGEEDQCFGTVQIIEENQKCLLLSYSATPTDSLIPINNPVTLDGNKIYKLQSTLAYDPPKIKESPGAVTYTTKYGYFAKAVDIPGLPIFEDMAIPDPDLTNWSPTLENIPTNKLVFFFPQPDLVPGVYENAVQLMATGAIPKIDGPECFQSIDLIIHESEQLCDSINLKAEPWPYDPDAEKTKIYVDPATSTFGTYEGDFQFTITKGTKEKLYKNAELMDSAKTTTKLTFNEATEEGVYLTGINETWTVTVKATDEGGEFCETSLPFVPAKQPPEIEKEICTDLTILTPAVEWIDSGKTDEEFIVKVTGTPEDYPWNIQWEIITDSGTASWENPTGTSLTNKLKNLTAGIQVKVSVVGHEDACHKERTLQGKGEPGPDPNPGPGSTTKPKIKKLVRNGEITTDPDDTKGWNDIINISGIDENNKPLNEDDEYITYKVSYRPGTSSIAKNKSEIWEASFDSKDPGVIEAEDEMNGELEFTDNMLIKFSTEKASAHLCYYGTDDKGDEELICTENDLEFDKNNYVENLDDLEDDFWNNFKDEFAKGNHIVFKNIANVNTIEIFYEMENKTSLDKDTCAKLKPDEDGCGEEFKNEIKFKAGSSKKGSDGSDSTKVIAICPYILTRSSGDVFFNSPLTTGTDVAYCSPQKNIQGPVITPIKKKEEIFKSGGTEDEDPQLLSVPSHDICKYSNTNQNQNFIGYNNPFTHFSSTICEMKAEVAEWWIVENVVNSINSNITKISRWSTPNTQAIITESVSQLYHTNGIFRWDGDKMSGDKVIINSLTIKEDDMAGIPAAQTFIIRNADLYIRSEITYDPLPAKTEYNDPKSVPSAAFIVIDGDIIIDEKLEELYGTFIAIDTTPAVAGDQKGQIKSSGITYDHPLTIYGGLIGDVTDLFTNRRYVGNIASDDGSVTIKYLQNFIINTPPGLSDLMNLSQLEVAY